MGSYLQQYGEGDERRSRNIKRIVLALAAVIFLALAAYLLLNNFSEKQRVRHFLAEVNDRKFEEAYRDWGCTPDHPCRDYSFQRFMEDWGPNKKTALEWKIASVDGCTGFVTVNVQAKGAELQSLMVERGTGTLGFAPSPECQEKKWRWNQFFRRVLGRS